MPDVPTSDLPTFGMVYVESSAVLAWLLGESTEQSVRRVLDGAERVVTSALTAVECARALARARVTSRITPTEELAAVQLLHQAEQSWDVHALTDRVLARARMPMLADPVRTRDALHVATMEALRESIGPITVLSLDERVRACATMSGFVVEPVQL
ncbi:MAG TPA: type II toxin-antitoxin system VapC family toxin [Gemmatimonas sp.]|nr:type II toxin-antitoxin system VapC family toxin [Gemmatimonas sp.]